MTETLPIGRETMSSAMPDAVNYHRWILSLIMPHVEGPLLEIGIGAGQYAREMAPMVDAYTGIDIEPDFMAIAEELPDYAKLQVADITNAGLAQQVGAGEFKSAVCLNVLEHIEDDVATLGYFRECLAPGGRLMLLVPALQALYGPMDEMAGHFRRYSKGMLRQRLQSAGFEIRELQYFNPLGGLGWWVNAKFMKPKSLSDDSVNKQIMVYDKFVQPVSRLLNPLSMAFFGQSVWALAERPADDA